MTIDVKGPDGNVFSILGAFRRLTNELEASGTDVTAHRKLLAGSRDMRYDEILDCIEELTYGTIQFVNRD